MANHYYANVKTPVDRTKVIGGVVGEIEHTSRESYNPRVLLTPGSMTGFNIPRWRDMGQTTLDLTKSTAGGLKKGANIFVDAVVGLVKEDIIASPEANPVANTPTQSNESGRASETEEKKAREAYRITRRTREEVAAKVDRTRINREQVYIAQAAEGAYNQDELTKAGYSGLGVEKAQNIKTAFEIASFRKKLRDAMTKKDLPRTRATAKGQKGAIFENDDAVNLAKDGENKRLSGGAG